MPEAANSGEIVRFAALPSSSSLPDPAMTPDAASLAEVTLRHEMNLRLAHRLLCRSISGDYLSNGRGHRQSRRVVADRQSRQKMLTSLAASPAAHGKWDRLPRRGSGDIEFLYTTYVTERPRLTSREEYRLAARMKGGDVRARDTLIESNLGLVVMLARRYQRPGVPLLDLIAEGNFGLLTAADRFDPERGNRFSTYAKWWVLRAMKLALPTLIGVVRQPVSKLRLNAAADLDDLDDLDECGLPQGFEEAGPEADAVPRPEALVPISAGLAFNAPVPSAEEVLNGICGAEEQEPPQELMARQRSTKLRLALDSLSERDRTVISQRYALTTDEASTLTDTAACLSVSIERVRQIEKAALKKLHFALCAAGLTADTAF